MYRYQNSQVKISCLWTYCKNKDTCWQTQNSLGKKRPKNLPLWLKNICTFKHWKLLLISPPDGVAHTALMIPADTWFIYLEWLLNSWLILWNHFYSFQKSKIHPQRLNKITKKTENLLSLHNSWSPLIISRRLLLRFCLFTAFNPAAVQQIYPKFQRM